MPDKWNSLWEQPLDRKRSLTEQIVERCKDAMMRNDLKRGLKVPPIRVLSRKLSVAEGTVKTAYLLLQSEGYFEPQRHRGTFVINVPGSASKAVSGWTDPVPYTFRADREFYGCDHFSFSPAFLKIGAVFPAQTYLRADQYYDICRSLAHRQNLVNHGHGEDTPDAMLRRLLLNRGIEAEAGQHLVLPGASGLLLAAETLVKPGDLIVMASPLDMAARATFLRSGASLAFAGSDDEGILTDGVERICREKRVKAVLVRPAVAFPENVTLSERRRDALLALAAKYYFVLIAMDNAGELWFRRPLIPLAGRHHKGEIIHIGSLSTLAGSLGNFDVLVAGRGFVRSVARHAEAYLLPYQPEAWLPLLRYINLYGKEPHIKKLMLSYRKLLDEIREAFNHIMQGKAVMTEPLAGLALWITFSNGIPSEQLLPLFTRSGFDDYEKRASDPPPCQVSALHIGFGMHDISSFRTLFEGLSALL
ncbi:GntR family transcriptional regulator [Pararcticibacter amylolyticus]|uniref:HTH gntR-type domain-containing protein n=1 Tax=Pararcticibacter amylolyticus TaxID=2173175 RepID=A0A2U2PA22_9SPHI|nr:PLP-dependent aminotransferase family protein [Pararcticibacter amylolyticus]PWG78195.1 hypothetical protein DDR33_23610 [Pararcticibacter amylolyticus]